MQTLDPAEAAVLQHKTAKWMFYTCTGLIGVVQFIYLEGIVDY